jgi:RNA polymerase sigma-70 factor, ECF subfamily
MSETGHADSNFSAAAVYVSQDADDHVAIRRCLEGDPGAFEPIVLRYQRVLFTVALRILGDREDANDAAQNAFVKAYEKLGTFDASRRFFSWIYRILVNECLNLRRDRRTQQEVTDDLPGIGTPADALEREERCARVQKAIVALPMEYREVVVLRHFAELSYEEIGRTIGIPAGVVKSRLHTARQRLGRMLLETDSPS